MHGSGDIRHERVFCYFGSFLLFKLPYNLKNQNFQKMKKKINIYIYVYILSFYTDILQMMIIWCMVPEKWRNGVPQTDFFVISDYFLPFYPPNNIKIEQMKKMPGNIISLKCTIKDKHMMYDSWDMNRDRECFAILCYFLPFYSPNNPKKQNEKKKREKHPQILPFDNSVPKIMIICHTVTEIWCITDVIIIFHFGLCFALLPP